MIDLKTALLYQTIFSSAIIPIRQKSKTPTRKWGQYTDASKLLDSLDIEVIVACEHPGGWAVLTGPLSGVVVVDPDDAYANEWVKQHLPASPMMTQTSKGFHYYYRYNGSGVRSKIGVRTTDGVLKLDIKAENGYVLLPGSEHPSGAIYQPLGYWCPGIVQHLPIFDPQWFPEVNLQQRPAVARVSDYQSFPYEDRWSEACKWMKQRWPAVAGEGGDIRTFLTASKLVNDLGLTDQDALWLMREWNKSNEPPWKDQELRVKIENAKRYGGKK